MKTCTECNEEKDLKEFYKHKSMLDGYLNKCKVCVKTRVNNHRVANIEKIMEYDRNRPNSRERVKKNSERIERYKKEDPIKYKKAQEQKNKWAKENRNKNNAQQQARRAVFKGTIKRLYKCERCEETENLQGHHPDYSKPLEVLWLCPKCHGAEHARLNEIKRKKDER